MLHEFNKYIFISQSHWNMKKCLLHLKDYFFNDNKHIESNFYKKSKYSSKTLLIFSRLSYSHINVHLEKHTNFTLLFWILTQILDILSKAVGRKSKGPAILFFIREKGTPNKSRWRSGEENNCKIWGNVLAPIDAKEKVGSQKVL